MSIYDSIIEDICLRCGNKVYSEGINNGIGYVYPPFHCSCGWCSFEDKEECKKCDQYEKCYSL
mgnify:FL=1